MGGLIGLSNPRSGRLPGPALCGGCWPLVGGTRSQMAGCRSPGDPGLVLDHWWVELGFKKSLNLCLPTSG